jgi:hypothetical protein
VILGIDNLAIRFYIHGTKLVVVVAQLVEPQIVILVVAGSSPVDHPISSQKIPNSEYS